MLRKVMTIAVAALTVMGIHLAAIAASNGTPEEAKSLVEKAVKLIETEGKEKAFAAFNDPSGTFVDRDLYVFVLDLEGTVVAHGANRGLIGKSLFNLKDADGKAFMQDMVAMAKRAGTGWIDYKWPNPTTKKLELKSSYVQKAGDVIVGVGVYKG